MLREIVVMQLSSTLQPIELFRLLLATWLASTFIVSLTYAVKVKEGRRISILGAIASLWLLLSII